MKGTRHTLKETKGNRGSSGKTHATTEDINNTGAISTMRAATCLLLSFSFLGEVKVVGEGLAHGCKPWEKFQWV